MIDLLPPNPHLETAVLVHLNILSAVLDELTKACGVNISDTITKGIKERQIIQSITLQYIDRFDTVKAKLSFVIDWNAFTVKIINENGYNPYKDIDFTKGYCNALDKKLYNAVKKHHKKIMKEYKIKRVECCFHYKDEIEKDKAVNDRAMAYLGHSYSEKMEENISESLSKKLTVAFNNFGRILNIEFWY